MVTETQLPVVPDEIVMSKIYLIRGHKVMLDKDLADLYKVETRVLNQAVSRNMDRFPSDFMFQLNEKEWENLISQIVISSWGGRRKLPFVFTEHGVLMLSSVLNSRKAIQINILIMRVFTRIRSMLTDNTELRLAIEKLEKKADSQAKSLDLVFKYMDELMKKNAQPKPRKRIGFQPSPDA
jgi:hypothetical protein